MERAEDELQNANTGNGNILIKCFNKVR